MAAGLSVAVWTRWRLPATDPAAWAWPMAVAIAFAPVIYPWYLLCLTPFLFSVVTLPLTAWTVSALSVYEVWDLSRHGGRWITPVSVMTFEFGVLVIATVGSPSGGETPSRTKPRRERVQHEVRSRTKTHEELHAFGFAGLGRADQRHEHARDVACSCFVIALPPSRPSRRLRSP